jgi:hypothetical protein
MQPQGSCRRQREGGEGRTSNFVQRYNRAGYSGKCDYRDPAVSSACGSFLKSPTIICRPSVIFSGFHRSWTLNSPEQKTGRRLIIFLVRLVTVSRKRFCTGRRLPGKVAPSCLSEHQLYFWWRRWRVSVPVLIPALVLPEETLAETHLKKPCKRG